MERLRLDIASLYKWLHLTSLVYFSALAAAVALDGRTSIHKSGFTEDMSVSFAALAINFCLSTELGLRLRTEIIPWIYN